MKRNFNRTFQDENVTVLSVSFQSGRVIYFRIARFELGSLQGGSKIRKYKETFEIKNHLSE